MTAEMATCLPVLVLLLGVVLSAVSVAGVRVRAQDAAREAVRAVARGDAAAADQLAQQYAPGAMLTITKSADQVTVVARVRAHLLSSWLPSVTVTERAVAAVEPISGLPP
ncbi:MAG: TadE family type IV pilus minor pilin [Jatrophihabitantaceae bacterium]